MIYLGKEFAKLGEQVIYDMIRFYSMSIADFLGEYFESDLVKRLSGSGIIGSAMGVYSPGTAYVLLHHYMGDVDGSIGAWGFARGGMGSVSKAIASAFKAHGGEIVTDAPVERVLVRNGRVTGVATANGNEYRANIVVSNRPEAHLPQALRREGPPPHFSSVLASSRSAVPRASSTSRSRAARVPGARARQSAALRRHALPRFAASATSAPTTTGRTAPGRRTRTSTC